MPVSINKHMTRVNTLNEIADIYLSGSEIIQENETVGKMKADTDLEEEKGASKTVAKDTGPEAAENYDKKVNEAGGAGKKEENNHFSSGDTGKTTNEDINTYTMDKKKSIFDKLYEDVLGGDDDLDMEMPFGGEMGDSMDDGDEPGDEPGDEVTLSLPRDLAEQLMSALEGQLGGDDDIEDIEDTEDMEEMDEKNHDHDDEEDDDMMQEAPEVQHVGDAGPGGTDMDKGGLKGKNNKVSGSGSAHKTSSGHGDGSVKTGNPEPTPLGDKHHALTGKNNKVPGKVKGGNQELYG